MTTNTVEHLLELAEKECPKGMNGDIAEYHYRVATAREKLIPILKDYLKMQEQLERLKNPTENSPLWKIIMRANRKHLREALLPVDLEEFDKALEKK